MATTNKGFEQPSSGTENWNIPLNDNFGYIDSAFGGQAYIDVTGRDSTPQLMTVSQYRNLILNFNGTLTSDVVYMIPSGVSGTWIIANYATGPHNLYIDNAAVGAAVIIPNGARKSVFSDGTNVFFIEGAGAVSSVNVSGGTTGLTTSGGPITSSGTITLAGTLGIANGGTGGTDQSSALSALGAQPALGFTPVQQGGPGGTSASKIYLGWRSDNTGIVAQVDSGGYLGRVVTNAYYEGATSGYPQSSQIFAPGDAPLYACRAWVMFEGFGGNVYSSGNVTSVQRVDVGRYVVNFAIQMPDANYATIVTMQGNNGDGTYLPGASITPVGVGGEVYSTSQVGVMTKFRIFSQSGGYQDAPRVCLAVFR